MDALLDEIESLEAILMGDVRININLETGYPEIIETTILPAVEHNSEQQYICVDLQVMPSKNYPETSPDFNLVKPRGLDDTRLEAIKLACHEKLEETQGSPVVFDLIDVIREHLSVSNIPCGQCVICLYGFRDGDKFTRTECYHYLHSYCLARHLITSRKNYHEEQEKLPLWIRKASETFQASCPVCRKPINDDSKALINSLPPKELAIAPEFQLTDELIMLQNKMSNLFIQQKKRGGIIDVQAEVAPLISIEPTDGYTRERENENGAAETSNSLKDSRQQLKHNTKKKSRSSGNTSFQNQKSGQCTRKLVRVNMVEKEASAICTSDQLVSGHSDRKHIRGRLTHNKKTENADSIPIGLGSPQSKGNKRQKDQPNCSAGTR